MASPPQDICHWSIFLIPSTNALFPNVTFTGSAGQDRDTCNYSLIVWVVLEVELRAFMRQGLHYISPTPSPFYAFSVGFSDRVSC
jgi:hypothetical protein